MSRSCRPLIVVSPASLTDTVRSRSQGRHGRARSPDRRTRQSFVLDDDHERCRDVSHLGGGQTALEFDELAGVEALDLHDVGGLDPLEPLACVGSTRTTQGQPANLSCQVFSGTTILTGTLPIASALITTYGRFYCSSAPEVLPGLTHHTSPRLG